MEDGPSPRRTLGAEAPAVGLDFSDVDGDADGDGDVNGDGDVDADADGEDRNSTRLNSSHRTPPHALFCLQINSFLP